MSPALPEDALEAMESAVDRALDAADPGDLTKERLGHLLPPFLELANERIEPALTPGEVASYYRWDARMWTLLQFLRRLDRFWQRRLRRRVYPFLLPERVERHV